MNRRALIYVFVAFSAVLLTVGVSAENERLEKKSMALTNTLVTLDYVSINRFLHKIFGKWVGKRYSCIGTMYNERWVLTSASCFKRDASNLLSWKNLAKWKAKIGEFQYLQSPLRYTIRHIVGRQRNHIHRHILKVIKHPDYDGLTNDIALVKLSSPVRQADMNSLTRRPHQITIRQPKRDPPSYDRVLQADCWTYGFSCGSHERKELRELFLRVRPLSECIHKQWNITRQLLGIEHYPIERESICIEMNGTSSRFCYSDFGAPLLCSRLSAVDPRTYQLAVTGPEPFRTRQVLPQLASRLPVPWIETVIGEN